MEFRTDRLLWFPAQYLVELRRLQDNFHSNEEDAALRLMLVATAIEDGSLAGFVDVDGRDRRASNVLFKGPRQSSTNHQVTTIRFAQRKICREDSGVVIATAATGDVEIDAAAPGIDTAGSRGGGEGQNELVPCLQTQGGPWDLAVHPSLGQFLRPCFTVRKKG